MKQSVGLKVGDAKYRVFSARNILFPDHIHMVYEIMIVQKGEITTTIDNDEYLLREGDCAVIFPLQHHSFSVDDESMVKICLFSTDFVPEFEQTVHGYFPSSPVFRLGEGMSPLPKESSVLQAKAFFYALCASICETVPLVKADRVLHRSSAVEKVLLYIDQNYSSDCSLQDAASVLGYDYTYLSRLFKRSTGYGFVEYLNRFRIDRACYLLSDSSTDITTVAISVGYSSVRTFNREFMKIMHATPSEYRGK